MPHNQTELTIWFPTLYEHQAFLTSRYSQSGKLLGLVHTYTTLAASLQDSRADQSESSNVANSQWYLGRSLRVQLPCKGA